MYQLSANLDNAQALQLSTLPTQPASWVLPCDMCKMMIELYRFKQVMKTSWSKRQLLVQPTA